MSKTTLSPIDLTADPVPLAAAAVHTLVERNETDALFRPEQVSVREPTEAERAVAEAALAAVPGGPDRLLYARVDLLPDEASDPVVIELELTEPSLWLSSAPGSADRFAAAIRAALPAPPPARGPARGR